MAEVHGPQRLGPLTPLVGTWEGNVGLDVSFRHEIDEVTRTSYFERFTFAPIPAQHNGSQTLEGLKYTNQAWRHGEEAMNPFHDEVGYMLWDEVRGLIMRPVVFGRGIAILAGSSAGPRDPKLVFKATPGEPHFGILQNPYLTDNAELLGFESIITFVDETTFSYTQNLMLKMDAMGGEKLDHTDENTLHRVDDGRS